MATHSESSQEVEGAAKKDEQDPTEQLMQTLLSTYLVLCGKNGEQRSHDQQRESNEKTTFEVNFFGAHVVPVVTFLFFRD